MQEYGFVNALNIECFMSSFETFYNSDYYFKGEFHDFWEVVYIISDKAGVSADEKIFELSRDDIIFHKPMEHHRIWAVNGTPVHAFIFSFRLSGMLSAKFENKVLKLSADQSESVLKLMEEFRQNAIVNCCEKSFFLGNKYDFLLNWNDDSPMNAALKCRAELLLFEILKSEISPKEQYSSKSADIYKKLVRFMENNVFFNLSVEDIAKSCNVSASYAKKIFAKYSDLGIHGYFIKQKIKKSIALLESGFSVEEVSDKLAFANSNYFGICFKRDTGYSPTKYLKRN